MSTQLDFVFPVERAALPAHPLLILRPLPDGRIESLMPDFKLRAIFSSWPHALDIALHPCNDHVSLRVRPWR